jgi:hypothetical protein
MQYANEISRERILTKILEFARENGRPPRTSEPSLLNIVYAAKKEFGSWESALDAAGLLQYRVWKQQRSLAGVIKRILDFNPMTIKELKSEVMKIPEYAKSFDLIFQTINNSNEIKSAGPRRKKVYFLEGQENLAEDRLDRMLIETTKEEEELLRQLSYPMTKEQILEFFWDVESTFPESKVESCLKRLLDAQLVAKARFIAHATGGQKYSATDLFGDLASKTFYYRVDYPKGLADFVIQNVPFDMTYGRGHRVALSHRLKGILPRKAFDRVLKHYRRARVH